MARHSIETKDFEQDMSNLELEGKTAMLIAVDHTFKGIVAVADTIKESAPEAIKMLQDEGLEVVMLTGDNERTAQAIANQVGIQKSFLKYYQMRKLIKLKIFKVLVKGCNGW